MGRLLVVPVEPQPAASARPVPDPQSTRRKRHNLAHRGERQALEAGLPHRVKRRTYFSLQNVSKSELSLIRQREKMLIEPARPDVWDTFTGRNPRKSCGYSDTAPACEPFRNLMPASQTPARSGMRAWCRVSWIAFPELVACSQFPPRSHSASDISQKVDLD